MVVSDRLKSLKAATSIRKGRLQLPPDDSIPSTGQGQDWATRARWPRGNIAWAMETGVGAQIDTVPRGMDRGSSRGLNLCLDRHA